MEHTYWVYILASGPHGTLYVGITNSLERRIAEHKAKQLRGFTATYGVDRLAYFRGFGDVHDAIHFEKQLKRWRRSWKVRVIEENNPHWADLYLDMMALPPKHPDIAAALATPQSLSSRFRRQAKTGTHWTLRGRTSAAATLRFSFSAELNGSRSLRCAQNRDDKHWGSGTWRRPTPSADPQ